jgi:hypothetical protein
VHYQQDARYANFSVNLDRFGWYTVASSSEMQPNTWHHIAGVWTKGDSLKIYVDGVLAGETNNLPNAALFTPDTTLPGSFPTSLGIYSQGNWDKSGFFKGQMSNVMIYNKALSNEEVRNLTSEGAQLLSIPYPSEDAAVPLILGVGLVAVALLVFVVVLVYWKRHKAGLKS